MFFHLSGDRGVEHAWISNLDQLGEAAHCGGSMGEGGRGICVGCDRERGVESGRLLTRSSIADLSEEQRGWKR